jgi:spermidine synthase
MIFLSLLIFASGAAALMYQTLWMRMFLLVFGNTAYAAAAVLAGFLLGLGLGYSVAGRHLAIAKNPLRMYGWLELGTGFSAVPLPWLLSWAQGHYSDLYTMFSVSLWVVTAIKTIVALLVMLPATFCMGATLPVLGEAVVAEPSRLGTRAGLVYGLNTLGGMAGCLAAAFWLPAVIGVKQSYELAVALNLAVGIAAWTLSRRRTRPVKVMEDDKPVAATVQPGHQPAVSRLSGGVVLAGVAGFCGLGLEVLWTRMFAQVLQNSVYSYAAIVVTVLAGLGLAALLVALLSARSWRPAPLLVFVTLGAGLYTGASPLIFYLLTDGLSYQWMTESWTLYLVRLFGLVSLVIGPAVVLGGMTLPLAWRLWEQERSGVGHILGHLTAWNTFSAVGGALIAGFVLLPAFGLWRAIFCLAALWCAATIMGVSLVDPGIRWRRVFGIAGVAGIGISLTATFWAVLPIVKIDVGKGEKLLAVQEGSHGIVAVVDRPSEHDRRIKVDNFYTLGGLASRDNELLEGQLPLLLHPAPKKVLHIGSATGISPAGALSFPVERVVAVELIPEVIQLASVYFADANRHLYDDPRVETVIADGRNYLLGTRERFDVIVADLFIPWHAGAGYLYSREQFALAKSRLADGGLFCQWLPLYQLSPDEFRLILATFLRVFPQATLWRGDFFADKPIVALIGHPDGRPLDLLELEQRLRRLRESGELRQKIFRDLAGVLMLYAGNLSASAERYAHVPSNTDDRPLLEYLAPRIVGRHGQAPVKGKEWFVGSTLASFYRELHADTLEKPDAIFPEQTLRHRQYQMAGEFFYNFNVLMALGQTELAGKSLEYVVDLVPEELYREDRASR